MGVKMISERRSFLGTVAMFALATAVSIAIANSVCDTAWGANPVSFFQVEPAADRQATNLVVNGSFAEWKNELPVGWSVGIGATDGANRPESRLAKGEGSSL